MPRKTLPYLLSLVNKVGFELRVWHHLMDSLASSVDLKGWRHAEKYPAQKAACFVKERGAFPKQTSPGQQD